MPSRWRTVEGFTTAIIATIVLGGALGVWSTWRVYGNDGLRAHSNDVRTALSGMMAAITDAETGQRGFLITGDPAYLEPYRRGTADIRQALAAVEQLTSGDAQQHARAAQLREPVDAKLSELAQTVALRRTAGFEAAQRVVATNAGQQSMDRIRAIAVEMTAYEDAILAAARAQSQRRVKVALLTDVGVAAIGIVLISVLRRMSRRRAVEAEERERLALRLAAIVQSSDDAIIGHDLDGVVTTWNAGAEHLYGYAAEEAIGRSIRLVVPPEKYGEEDAILERVRKGQSTERLETVRLSKDGTRVEVSLTVSPIKMASGEIVGASKSARDLTPLRLYATELERRVQERTTDLEAAKARLEAFAFSVAHDLRAPLRGVQGLSQALLEDYGDRLDEVGRDYARRVIQEVSSMDALIQDLLAYGRVSHIELAIIVVNLRDVVDAAVHAVRDEAVAARARVDVSPDLPTVKGNRSVLIQVFTNLLSNAIKFGGPDPIVRVWAEQRRDVAHVWVEDQGIGIAPQHHDRIFGVFERLHGVETYPGTGIGLAIVKKGIERLGGHVGVESQEGRGSRFWVELPRAEAA